MAKIDIAALKALAAKCSHNDGWNDEWVGRIARDTGLVTGDDARFIAACKPFTVLNLIDRLELAEAHRNPSPQPGWPAMIDDPKPEIDISETAIIGDKLEVEFLDLSGVGCGVVRVHLFDADERLTRRSHAEADFPLEQVETLHAYLSAVLERCKEGLTIMGGMKESAMIAAPKPLPPTAPPISKEATKGKWNGLPDNPNDDGEHWVKHPNLFRPEVKWWNNGANSWQGSESDTDDGMDHKDFAAIYAYIGPVAPPHTMALLREPSGAMVEAVARAFKPPFANRRTNARAAIAAVLKEIEA